MQQELPRYQGLDLLLCEYQCTSWPIWTLLGFLALTKGPGLLTKDLPSAIINTLVVVNNIRQPLFHQSPCNLFVLALQGFICWFIPWICSLIMQSSQALVVGYHPSQMYHEFPNGILKSRDRFVKTAFIHHGEIWKFIGPLERAPIRFYASFCRPNFLPYE